MKKLSTKKIGREGETEENCICISTRVRLEELRERNYNHMYERERDLKRGFGCEGEGGRERWRIVTDGFGFIGQV